MCFYASACIHHECLSSSLRPFALYAGTADEIKTEIVRLQTIETYVKARVEELGPVPNTVPYIKQVCVYYALVIGRGICVMLLGHGQHDEQDSSPQKEHEYSLTGRAPAGLLCYTELKSKWPAGTCKSMLHSLMLRLVCMFQQTGQAYA